MTRHLKISFLTLAASFFLLPACQLDVNSATENQSIVIKNGKVKGGRKTVCFVEGAGAEDTLMKYNPALRKAKEKFKEMLGGAEQVPHFTGKKFTDAEKKGMRTAVTNAYTLENAKVEFVGWEVCPELISKGTVLLFSFDNEFGAGGTASFIGTQKIIDNGLYEKDPEGNPTVTINIPGIMSKERNICNRTQEACVGATIIHEFGHILGLAHEHIHPKRDKECSNWLKDNPADQTFDSSYEKLGTYDGKSVMNYCYLYPWLKNKKSGNFLPTDKDLAAIRQSIDN